MHTWPLHTTARTMMPAAGTTIEHEWNWRDIVPITLLGTPEEVFEDFRAIGTPEDWAVKCGGRRGHDRATCLAVANLIVRGSEHMPKNPPKFAFIIEQFPTAQPGALWILDTSGHIGDDALYDHLFTNLGLPQMAATSEVSAERGAYYLLTAIEITVRNQREKDLWAALMTGKGGGKQGGSGSGPANPTAKGRGKAKEQKGNPPEMESRR